tara:strand:+ start:450 stop:662 length:213 start_codon:yes stop_codon:yes gene_type:complete
MKEHKVGDLVWFFDPSYINPYGGKREKQLAIIEEIKAQGERTKYRLTLVKPNPIPWRWAIAEYLENVETT